ncbi:hypothetical protein M9458_023761, partial [Cirrhinus mrigala]
TPASEWSKRGFRPICGFHQPHSRPRDQPVVPAHTPATEVELQLVTGHYYEELMDSFNAEDLIDWVEEVILSVSKSP